MTHRDYTRLRMEQSLAVKTFEELFAELGERYAPDLRAVRQWPRWTRACTTSERRFSRKPARCGWRQNMNPR